MQNATHTPWELKLTNMPSQAIIINKDYDVSLQINKDAGEFIVRACNCHDELLEALGKVEKFVSDLTDLIDIPGVYKVLQPAREAIKKAKGE